jgi:hypothetical protein
MHLYVICGHGAGDPGACGNGYSEAERVRALGARIAELGGSSVTLLDTSRNWYADRGIERLSIPSGDALVELHMDSASPDAHGGHVIIQAGIGGPDAYDRALAASISAIFPGRSQGIVECSGLANPHRAAVRGINYRLVENGFVTNAHDVEIFNSRLDDIAGAYLAAFGIGAAKTEEEEDMTKEEHDWLAYLYNGGQIDNPYSYNYNWKGPDGKYTARGGNMYNCINGTYDMVEKLLATEAAQTEAIKALAQMHGADPEEVAKAVSDAVTAKLRTIRLDVTTSE